MLFRFDLTAVRIRVDVLRQAAVTDFVLREASQLPKIITCMFLYAASEYDSFFKNKFIYNVALRKSRGTYTPDWRTNFQSYCSPWLISFLHYPSNCHF